VRFSTGCGECVPFTELIAKRGEHDVRVAALVTRRNPLTPANSGSLFMALVRLCISDRCNAVGAQLTWYGCSQS
jgi:hypothetical protein